jgi:hypothetical protein
MKSFRVQVASESAEIAAHPRLLSFPQGVPVDHADMTVNVVQKGTGKRRKLNVSSELNGVTFTTTEADASSKNDFYKFAVGILDESTGVMTLHAADHAFVMRPVVVGREDKLRTSATSYEAKRESLTQEFGSRKKKRALAAAQSNTISAENISGASAVEHAIVTSIADDVDTTSAIVSAADQALELNRMQLLPPYDESATSEADCYPLEGIINPTVSAALSELYDTIVQTAASDPNTSSKKELSDIFSARFSGGPEVFGTLMVGYHAAFPSSLPTELKKSEKKVIKAKMCQVLLLEYMLWMFREISAKFNKTITSEELVAALEDAPTGVFKYLTDSFAQFRKFNGKPSYVASKPVRYILRLRGCDVHYDRIVCDSDKTILHIIVLALHVTSFNVDLTLLAQVCSLVTIRLEYSVIDLFVCRI